jgi:hypothetical protein
MLALARWLSDTSASTAIRQVDWIIPVLQTIHILAISMILSSLLMLDLRVLHFTKSPTQSLADTARRFESWLWAGLVCLAATGLPLIVAEPQRTLPNASFQIKIVLLTLATTATVALRFSLRRSSDVGAIAGKASPATKRLAIVAFFLWCAVATAGRFVAYTQPN